MFCCWTSQGQRSIHHLLSAPHSRTHQALAGIHHLDAFSVIVRRLDGPRRQSARPPSRVRSYVGPRARRNVLPHPTEDGQVRVSLRAPQRDGTNDLVFDPVDFLRRLAVLVPHPRINRLLYHGVLGARRPPHGDGQRAASRRARRGGAGAEREGLVFLAGTAATVRGGGRQWAARLQRTFAFEARVSPVRRAPPARRAISSVLDVHEPEGALVAEVCPGLPFSQLADLRASPVAVTPPSAKA